MALGVGAKPLFVLMRSLNMPLHFASLRSDSTILRRFTNGQARISTDFRTNPGPGLPGETFKYKLYIHIYMIKLVQRFGNSGHVVLPKGYVGRRIRFIAEPKAFADIQSEVLEMLRPHLGNILGIYLYGSYARNEQSLDSDIDILAVTDARLKIASADHEYSIISVTIPEIEQTLQKNAVLLLPLLQEAKTIINPGLLEKYKTCRLTSQNTRHFLDHTASVLSLQKKGLELGFDTGSLVYSLILRIRGLLIIRLMRSNMPYSKVALFSYLQSTFSRQKAEEIYAVYTKEKNNIRVAESSVITADDIAQLISLAERLLHEANSLSR